MLRHIIDIMHNYKTTSNIAQPLIMFKPLFSGFKFHNFLIRSDSIECIDILKLQTDINSIQRFIK